MEAGVDFRSQVLRRLTPATLHKAATRVLRAANDTADRNQCPTNHLFNCPMPFTLCTLSTNTALNTYRGFNGFSHVDLPDSSSQTLTLSQRCRVDLV